MIYDYNGNEITGMRLVGKKLLGIGDSFIAESTAGAGNDLLSKIADGKNMTVYNYGVSSSSLAYDANETVPSVMSRYQSIIASVPAADYVVVLAGHNDSNPDLHGGTAISIGQDTDTVNTTFKGALNILIDALLTAYPTAGILFLTPFQRRGTEEPYVDAMIEMCAKYSVPVFDNFRESGIYLYNTAQDQQFDVGNLHLNAKGNERMAHKYIPILNSLA